VGTGPDEGAGRGRMRAGHGDREQVLAELKAAFVQGRLDKGELEERAGQAVAARTYGELAALTADIPDPAPSSEAASADAVAAGSTPGRTLARGVKRAGICMLAAAALMEAAFLTGNFLLIVAATFAALAAGGFLGYGIIDAIQERRALARLALGTGSGSGPGGTGSSGGLSARRLLSPEGPVPPGDRAGPALTEARRSIRVRAGRARIPQTMVGRPPMTRAQRGPMSWPTQPTMGPPIGVEPSQASAHSAITRPRISGLAASCRVVLASELKVILP
jgi:Domain of unknown function (DUF1707)